MPSTRALRGAFVSFVVVMGVIGWACAPEHQATEVNVTATDFQFKPREIRLKAQLPYQFRLQNKAGQLHDWTIDAMPAVAVAMGASTAHGEHDQQTSMSGEMAVLHMAAEGSQSADISFTPTRAGEYVFYCTVTGHRAAGMEGKIIVVR